VTLQKPGELRKLGQIYDELYRTSPFQDADRFYRWIVDRARLRAGPALDIGCGIGGALQAIAAVGGVPWGVDISREALSRARQACPGARLCLGDGARLPYPDGAFHAVLNLGNLEHFVDLEGGVREMSRVLSPTGRAFVLLPNLYYSGALWRVVRTGYGPDHHQPIDRFATRSEWRDVLEAGGLRVRRDWPYHKGKWWKRLLPANLAWHFVYECEKATPSNKTVLAPLMRRR